MNTPDLKKKKKVKRKRICDNKNNRDDNDFYADLITVVLVLKIR
jgi:hypothetical protein